MMFPASTYLPRHSAYLTHMIRALAALTVTAALLVATPAAHADPTPLPECATINDQNCGGSFQNFTRDDLFCQIVNSTQRCEAYWPFRNPTANFNAAAGDEGAFPERLLWYWREYDAVQSRAVELKARADRRAARIHRLERRVDRLRTRLHER